MKAMVYTRAGDLDVLQEKDIPIPRIKNGQVLVEIKASSLNIIDYERFRNLSDKVAPFPRMINMIQGAVGKPLGGEIAGVVSAVGKDVNRFHVGDKVYGRTPGIFPCGAWAEYATADATQIELMPGIISFEEAAVLPISGETALGAVNKAQIYEGHQVLVYGASGGVGQYAVQFAKAKGAVVTGVCSTRNIEMAKSIGCDHVIDYKKEQVTDIRCKYDRIIGINGCNPISLYRSLLKENGLFVCVGDGKQAMKALIQSPFSKKVTTYAAPVSPIKDYLSEINTLVDTGHIRPYIDHIYPIREVCDAIRYVITEHAQGKIALSVKF